MLSTRRRDTSAERLARLKPAFTPDGTVTAGNASQISDGAAAVVVTSREKADELGLRPLVEILAYGMSANGFASLHTVPAIAMQRALKPDEELVVLYNAGAETIRIHEFYAPSWHVIVLTGVDSGKNITRIISPADVLQLVCKVMKVPAAAKPVRISFITPKPKSE